MFTWREGVDPMQQPPGKLPEFLRFKWPDQRTAHLQVLPPDLVRLYRWLFRCNEWRQPNIGAEGSGGVGRVGNCFQALLLGAGAARGQCQPQDESRSDLHAANRSQLAQAVKLAQ